jgi:hypothetical protein
MALPLVSREQHSWGTLTVRGAPPAIKPKQGGIQECIERRRGPATGKSEYPGDKFYHGLARFPGDPQAFTTSKRDWDEKRAQRGMTKKIEDFYDDADAMN